MKFSSTITPPFIWLVINYLLLIHPVTFFIYLILLGWLIYPTLILLSISKFKANNYNRIRKFELYFLILILHGFFFYIIGIFLLKESNIMNYPLFYVIIFQGIFASLFLFVAQVYYLKFSFKYIGFAFLLGCLSTYLAYIPLLLYSLFVPVIHKYDQLITIGEFGYLFWQFNLSLVLNLYINSLKASAKIEIPQPNIYE